ncbi:MAG: hypothetical protein EAZ08_09080 [Cytophagales bacterium]|nr:MAG: hypothetical protein EAZ08_09080 [Cytophagales bacterium]
MTLFNMKTTTQLYSRQTIKVYFHLRTSSVRGEKGTVYCHISVDGRRTSVPFSTRIKVAKADWKNSKHGFIKQNSENYYEENHLKAIESDIKFLFYAEVNSRKKPSAESIKQLYLGANEQQQTLIDFIDEYVADTSTAGQLTKGTMKGIYKNGKESVVEFLEKNKLSKISIADFKRHDGKDYQNFLVAKGLSNGTINNKVCFLSAVLKMAKEKGIINENPLADWKMLKTAKKEIVYLTDQEVSNIELYEPIDKELAHIKDLFLFQVYTGFAFVDLVSFDAEKHIKIIDNREFIVKPRTKSGVKSQVPLFEEVKKILVKYNFKLLPDKSFLNSNYNVKLKKLCTEIGITKNITSHKARKTFAMNWLNKKGVSSDTVASMLGHDVKMLYGHYGEVTTKKIVSELNIK